MFIELNNDIAGFSTIWTLNIIGREAKMVKKGGWIVEMGSYCGRSSYVLGKNKDPSVLLTCIDTWPGSPSPIPDDEFIYGNINAFFNHSEFVNNMKSIKNFETLRCVLPINLANLEFSKKIDLLFMDLFPDQDLYSNQLNYWSKFMNKGSKIIVNDYETNRNVVDDFCLNMGLEVIDDMNIAIIGM